MEKNWQQSIGLDVDGYILEFGSLSFLHLLPENYIKGTTAANKIRNDEENY